MTEQQIKLIEELQIAGVGLLMSVPKYEDRKKYLEEHLLSLKEETALYSVSQE